MSSTPAHTTPSFMKRIPMAAYICIGAYLIIGVAYYLIFLMPKTVHFSFAEKTCIPHFMIAPSLHQSNSAEFTNTVAALPTPTDAPLASTELCFSPRTAPQPGTYHASISPFGGWIGAQQFTIVVDEPPKIATKTLSTTAVSAALPLSIPLSGKDTVHTYALQIGEKQTKCAQKDSGLSCDIAELSLAPGAEYEARLQRTFKGDGTVTLMEDTLETMVPIQLTDADIKDGDTIYDMREALLFTFDLPLEEAVVTLTPNNGERRTLETELKDKELKALLPEDIARKTDYTLEIAQAISTTGNSLSKPIVTTFTLSGGPKVKSVSIGANNVAQSAVITITFDQLIDESVDITKYAKITGVPASVQRGSPTTVLVRLQNAPLCAAFTLSVDKGIKSGINDELGDEAWKHTSRIVCGTSSVIGYSAKGRPIIAYYFGSGATTILFTGAIHGTEVSSYSTMVAWVQYLQANAHTLPANKRVVVVPNVNPDGVAAGTRNNSRNVNVGRNFPTANWKADIETASGVIKNGGGTSAGSEPEAQALIALTRQLRPRLEVSFHSQGRLVGANKFGDSVRIGDIYASTVGYQTMYHNAEAVMGYPMTGEYEDWMGESMGIPAILIELPSHNGNYLTSQLKALLKMVNI